MSEHVEKSSEGKDSIDLSKYVPKEDFDKVSNSLKDLESKLEEAKLSLLDPEYIAFKESIKGKSTQRKVEKATEISAKDLEGMTSAQVLDLAVERAREAILSEISANYDDSLRKMHASISEILGVLEVERAERDHPDFNTYRDDIVKIIESSSTPITVEQAYKIAKANAVEKIEATDKEKKEKEKQAAAEKPSGVSKETTVPKTFKSKQEAADDAWARIVGADKEYI